VRKTPYKNGIFKLNRLDALSLWHRVNLDSVLDEAPDLSARQMAILTTVYLEPGPHTVSSLARRLDVTKAVITRAIGTLGRIGLVGREADPNDKRSALIQRTGKGSQFLSQFADNIRSQIKLGIAKSEAA